MAKKREFNVFSLSFLDIMSCGFGAVILIFIIIHHSTEVTTQELSIELMAEVKKLEVEVTEGAERMVQLKTTIRETDDEIVTTEGVVMQIIRETKELEALIAATADSGTSTREDIELLKQDLLALQREAASLEGSVGGDEQTGTSLRSFVGEGDRQYLTGLNVGGEHILILVDASTSMLHQTIVNAVRLSFMADAEKIKAEKWQRAIRTVEWIMANLPHESKFQIMTFNESSHPMAKGGESIWQDSIDRSATDEALANLKTFVPNGGTSLHHPFAALRAMETRPDNIFLIVDSLPTRDFSEPKRSAIRSDDRVRLFASALNELPQDIPVNVILFPMEGDPLATPYFWMLAQTSGGSFLTPSKDWP